MLMLLPPSEGKESPRRGRPLDLEALSFPALNPTRERVLEALTQLCGGDPETARVTLGLTEGQRELVSLNAGLCTAPTARADRVYTGVVFDALSASTLSTAAKRRAATRVAITSSVFGLVRFGDPIAAYRLSGDVTLPGLGTVASTWRDVLGASVVESVGSGLLVDLRSGMYANFWRPEGLPAAKVATVRVLHEVGGVRKVVSHFNKATKGRLVREVLESGADPRNAAALAEALRDLGWYVETDASKAATRLDVVVHQL